MKKLLLSVFMVLLALPAFAFNIYNTPEGDKVDIYGSIRVVPAYQNSQGFYNGVFNTAKSDLMYQMFATSRFGVDFKMDKLFGTVEFNFNMDGSNVTNLGFRQLFAGYDFGNGHKLTFGQKTILTGTSYAFADYFFGDNSFAGFGALSSIRRPTIVYSYYGLDLGLVENTDLIGKSFLGSSTDATKKEYNPAETYIPRFEIAYNFKFDNVVGKVGGSYGLFTEKSDITGKYKNINAGHAFFVIQPKFAKGYISTTGFYSYNAAMYGIVKDLELTGANSGMIGNSLVMPDIDANGKVMDVHSWGIALEGGYTFTDYSSIVVGAGFQMNMSDKYKQMIGDGKAHTLNDYGVYVQAPFKLNKYMKIVPGIGYYSTFLSNTSDANKTNMSTLLAGVEFKVDF